MKISFIAAVLLLPIRIIHAESEQRLFHPNLEDRIAYADVIFYGDGIQGEEHHGAKGSTEVTATAKPIEILKGASFTEITFTQPYIATGDITPSEHEYQAICTKFKPTNKLDRERLIDCLLDTVYLGRGIFFLKRSKAGFSVFYFIHENAPAVSDLIKTVLNLQNSNVKDIPRQFSELTSGRVSIEQKQFAIRWLLESNLNKVGKHWLLSKMENNPIQEDAVQFYAGKARHFLE